MQMLPRKEREKKLFLLLMMIIVRGEIVMAEEWQAANLMLFVRYQLLVGNLELWNAIVNTSTKM